MSEAVKKSDLVENDIFLDLAKEIDKAQESLSKYDKDLVSIAENYSKLAKSMKETSTDLAALVDIEKKAAKNTENLQKARLDEIRLNEQREKAFDRYEKQLQKEAAAKEKAAKAAEKERIANEKAAAREKKINDDKNNAYKQLAASTAQLKNESKRLGAELLILERAGETNTKTYKRLSQQYKEVTRSAQEGDAQLKRLDATVGDNQRKVGMYERALNGLSGAIGALGLAFGAGALIDGTRQLLTNVNELNLQASRLGISAENISSFASSASALGNTFGTDARENMIAANALMKEFDLTQQEAFELMEQGYLSGANAQGDMLDSVKEYSAQIRASGGDADTLFNILSRSGQEGIFSDKGVDVVKEFGLRIREQASSTSEAMRKAFGDEFTDEIFGAINNGSMTSVQALELVAEKMKDTTIPTNELQTVIADVFGGAGEDAGLRFIQTLTNITDETGNLVDATDPYIKQQMEAQQLNERLATSQQQLYEALGGSGATLDSLILKFKVLFFENIRPALTIVGKLAAAFVAYKSIVIALTAVEKARNLSLAGLGKTLAAQIPMTKAYRQQQQLLATQATASGNAVKGAGNAMKAVPWLAIIGVLIEVATAFYDIASNAKAAREQQELTDKYVANADKKSQARITERTRTYEQEMKALDAKRQKDLAAAKTDEQRAKIEAEFLKTKQALTKATENEVRSDIRAKNARRDELQSYKDRLEAINAELKTVDQTSTAFNRLIKDRQSLARAANERLNLGINDDEFLGLNAPVEKTFQIIQARIRANNDLLTEYNAEWKSVKDGVFDATTELEVNSIAQKNNSDKITAKIPVMKSLNTQFKEQNEYISRQSELLKEISDIETEQQIRQQERNLADLLLGDDASIADAKVIIDEITNLRQEAINRQYDLDAQRLDEKLAAENKAERDALEKQREDLMKAAEGDIDAQKKIEANYQKELDAIAIREKARAADVATEKKLVEMKRVEELIAAEDERADKLNSVNDEILSKQKESVTSVNDEIKKDTNELIEMVTKAQDELTKLYEKSVERKIDAAKKEEELADEQIKRLQDLANNGAILDEQSIKDAEQRKRDAIKEQLRLAKQQERAQFIQSALANITNQLKNGKSTGEAVSSTVGLQSALKALFAGFPGFYKGTNNAPEGLAWVDEKGAEIHTDKHGRIKDLGSDKGARLKFIEGGDKIIPHPKSLEILSGLPSVREPKGVQIDPSLRLLEEQNRILKNAMESKITAEELGRIIHLTTEDKKGNLSRINRYKYHR